MNNFKNILLATGIAAFSSIAVSAQTQNHILEIDGKNTNIKIQPTMYGIFFEDINQAADGGLYAELIKNRSFEFYNPLMGWLQPKSDVHSENKNSGYANIINNITTSNHNYARISIFNDKNYELLNEGFKGIGLHQNALYNLSFLLQSISGDIKSVNFELLNEQGKPIAKETVSVNGNTWKKYSASLKPSETVEKGKLRITFNGNGVINMDMISLFPNDTWKNRPNGLRKDLVQKLYDLRPGFLRFPGGCIVEGRNLAERYQWKKTVGAVEDRETLINRWNTEFAHRPAPDYFQSFGLGFFEYFQLAEDLGAAPLPILSCGIACQFNTGELVNIQELKPYIDDALDLIEFANGDSKTTKWGALRAEMGHPQPFNLTMIGVGNEQWGSDYIERYKLFEKAIHSKYPQIKIVSGSGPSPSGEYFDYGWNELKKLNAQYVDEHYYNSPEWFQQNATRYDKYDRTGPKVFAGEYAAQSVATVSPDNKNNWITALSEAAFMTGLERNADVVYMTSYAPLFAHAEGWQWTPDLIWFNNLASYATPNYYVQKLFSNYKGTDLISIQENGQSLTGQNKLYASAVQDKNTNSTIIKIVNTDGNNKSLKIKAKNLSFGKSANIETLKGNSLTSENSFSDENIKPIKTEIKTNNKDFNIQIPAYSFVTVTISNP